MSPRIMTAIKAALLTVDIVLAGVCVFTVRGIRLVDGAWREQARRFRSAAWSDDMVKRHCGIVVSDKRDANRQLTHGVRCWARGHTARSLCSPGRGEGLGVLSTPSGSIGLVALPGGWLCVSMLRRIWSAPRTGALGHVTVAYS
jgi:hypothetical protein